MEEKDWKDFKDGIIVVGCKTIEQAKSFLKACAEQGITWCDGVKLSISKTNWKVYGNLTVYMVMESGGLMYSKRARFNSQQIKDYTLPVEGTSDLKYLWEYTETELVDELYRRKHNKKC